MGRRYKTRRRDAIKKMTSMKVMDTGTLHHEFHPNNVDYPFHLDGKRYLSLTHYIQSIKYGNSSWAELVRTSATVDEARYLGQRRLYPIDPHWASQYERLIRQGIKARFDEHPFLKSRLMKCCASHIYVNFTHRDYGDRHTPYERNIIGRLMLDVLAEYRENRLLHMITTETQRVSL